MAANRSAPRQATVPAVLIGLLTIVIVHWHESAVDIASWKAAELPAEIGCASVTASILVHNPPAEIRDFVRIADEVAISVPIGFNAR
jgi:hypothetical protein